MRIGGFEKLTLIDYPHKIACMVYTIGCNFRCPYCHNPELVDETADEISADEIFTFLDDRKGILDGVVITGGEPTMHDDLLDFMAKIKEKGYKIKLDSNGTRPDMLKEAIDRELVDYIAMDIKSPLAKYSANVSRPVDADAIRRSIRIIMDSHINYEFRTTVIKSLLSYQDLKEIVSEIKGSKRYYLQKFIPTKILNPQFRNKVSYSDEEFKELQKLFSKKVDYCGIR